MGDVGHSSQPTPATPARFFAGALGSSYSSATDASLRMLCESTYADCVTGGLTQNCSEFPSPCTATVSEYNRCVSDSAQILGGLPPCSALTRASLATTLATLTSQQSIAACMSVESKCPGAP